MSDLSKIVRDRLRFLGSDPGDCCLVGLSGGQDSTALLLALLSDRCRTGTVVAAHLDHAVRDGSEQDLINVESMCQKFGIRFIGHRLDPKEVRTLTRRTGSLEASLRKFRYDFLCASAASCGAKWVLTGHTVDDQVETVLFRVLRGMDPMSLSGIPEKRSRILRPLLTLERTRTLSYCLSKGVEPLEDPSNLDHRYARNRLRNRTIPSLESTFHPRLKELMLQMASFAGRLDSFRKTVLAERFRELFDPCEGHLPKKGFEALPPVFREPVVAGFLRAGIGRWPSRSLLKEAFDRIRGEKRGTMSLPGGMVMIYSGKGFSIRYAAGKESNDIPKDPVPFPLPGSIRFDSAKITLSSEEIALEPPFIFPGGDTGLIRKNQLRTPLWVRRRVPGDRFIPLGMDKQKKLKDFLIDRKIPRSIRDNIPLILDNAGEILWVGGVEVSRYAALEGYEGEKVILIRITRGNDPGDH